MGDRFAAVYLHHAHHRLTIFERDGRPVTDVRLPGIGTIVDLAGRRADDELFLTFMSFAAPAALLAVAMADGTLREVSRPDLPWDPDDFVTEQVFVSSGDGTQVPLFLTRRRDTVPDGAVPTLLYGYGGFRIAIGPIFRAEWLAWIERGGLLAVASLRGGGEYGKAWHDAGRLANKQNVFDDFAACARWLAASGWTRRERLGISGRSNGGLLVGASITQHPELFGAAVAEVGVMDMLRFDRFTIGWGWTSDYGSPDDADAVPDAAGVLAAAQHPGRHRPIPRRWSRPATTTTASSPATRSSSRRRCRPRRPVTRRSSSGSTRMPGTASASPSPSSSTSGPTSSPSSSSPWAAELQSGAGETLEDGHDRIR